MRILGIDPAASTGLVGYDTVLRTVFWRDTYSSRGSNLWFYRKAIEQAIVRVDPQVVVAEAVALGANRIALVRLAEYHGVIKSVVAGRELTMVTVSPSTWRAKFKTCPKKKTTLAQRQAYLDWYEQKFRQRLASPDEVDAALIVRTWLEKSR